MAGTKWDDPVRRDRLRLACQTIRLFHPEFGMDARNRDKDLTFKAFSRRLSSPDGSGEPRSDEERCYQELRRFLRWEKSSAPRTTSNLYGDWLRGCMRLSEEMPGNEGLVQTLALLAGTDGAIERERPEPGFDEQMAGSTVEEVADLLVGYGEDEPNLFGLPQTSACYAYRYSRTPGQIIRSVFEFSRNDERNVVEFMHWRRHQNQRRPIVTRGLASIVNAHLYLVGRTEKTNEVKVAAFPRPAGTVADGGYLPGVMLTMTSRGPLVGRLVLVFPGDGRHLTEADAQAGAERETKPTEQSIFHDQTLREDIVARIRNEVRFEIMDPIIACKDEAAGSIPQHDMVARATEILRGEFELVQPNGERRPFNPVVTDEYPFNQAIQSFEDN